MTHDHQSPSSPPGRHRGPQGLGEAAAAVLGSGIAAGESLGEMEAQDRLRKWAEAGGCLISELEWFQHQLVSAATAEHEVRYRAEDHRAWKKTWPGTFGFIPARSGSSWKPRAATPVEYLLRQRLQNDIFNDEVRMEGIMVSDGPSMIIGQPAAGISLVISQPWLDAADESRPHPDERDIAAYLKARGFTALFDALYGWIRESDGIVILDAKPDNFILTERGILPVDLLITEILPVP